jgi:hypothetical protein
LATYVRDTDPYVRAAAVYALSERGAIGDEVLEIDSADEHELVRETAVGLRERSDPTANAASSGVSTMLTVEKMIALRCVPLFAALGPVALEELAQSSTDTRYASGEMLCIEGEPGEEVFVVLSGEVDVVSGATREGGVLRVERAGSVIGEMAVLESTLRSASVFAGGEGARVLRLNGAAFHAVLDTDPAVAEGVIRILAQRIRTRDVPEIDLIA